MASRSRFKKFSSLDSGILLLVIYSNEIIFITRNGITFLNIGGSLDFSLCKETSFLAQSLPQPLRWVSLAQTAANVIKI